MIPLAITGLGAFTALGDGAAECAANARAGLMAFGEYPYQPLPREAEDDDRPLLAAPVRSLPPDLDGPSRLLELGALALTDLLRDAELAAEELRGVALLVSLPFPDAAVTSWGLGRDHVSRLAARAGIRADHLHTVESGAAGMIELVAEAARLIGARAAQRVVVLGADSYLAEDRLRALDAAYRIKSPRNVDGFLPGEAATAVLLETPERAEKDGTTADAVITAVGLGSEPEPFPSEKQSTAAGLTQALSEVLPSPPSGEGAYLLCDLNGESYRAIEWGLAMVRLGERLGPVRRLVHPANGWGDIGAATGGGLLALAAASFRRDYAPSRTAIVFAGSDGPRRAALRLSRA